MLLLSAFLLFGFKVFLESCVFGIFHAFFQMECQRQGIKYIFVVAAIGVIVPHVDEERLLIIQMLVEFKAIVSLLHCFLASLQFGFDGMLRYQDLVIRHWLLLAFFWCYWVLFLELFIRVVFFQFFLSVYLRQLDVLLVFRDRMVLMMKATGFRLYLLFWFFRASLTVNLHNFFFFPFSFALRICCCSAIYNTNFAVCNHFKNIFKIFSEFFDSCHMIITLDLSPLCPHDLSFIKIYLLNSLLGQVLVSLNMMPPKTLSH